MEIFFHQLRGAKIAESAFLCHNFHLEVAEWEKSLKLSRIKTIKLEKKEWKKSNLVCLVNLYRFMTVHFPTSIEAATSYVCGINIEIEFIDFLFLIVWLFWFHQASYLLFFISYIFTHTPHEYYYVCMYSSERFIIEIHNINYEQ